MGLTGLGIMRLDIGTISNLVLGSGNNNRDDISNDSVLLFMWPDILTLLKINGHIFY